MSRTGKQRIDAIPQALEQRQDFAMRLNNAGEDLHKIAALMAEAIAMECRARGLEAVDKNGKTYFTTEDVLAAHCAIDAAKAYHNAIAKRQGRAST